MDVSKNIMTSTGLDETKFMKTGIKSYGAFGRNISIYKNNITCTRLGIASFFGNWANEIHIYDNDITLNAVPDDYIGTNAIKIAENFNSGNGDNLLIESNTIQLDYGSQLNHRLLFLYHISRGKTNIRRKISYNKIEIL